MKLRVTWINGTETDLEVETLRDLDRFVGDHTCDGITVDLKPLDDGLRLVFLETESAAA